MRGLLLLPLAALLLAAGATSVRAGRALPSDKELAELQSRLNYTFSDPWLLRQALVHPSFGEWNNHRLAWLGDAMMTAVASELAYRALPANASAEQLHESRKAVVGHAACARFAQQLGLDQLMVVGTGFKPEGRARMLAEGFEAVWGAVYVDARYRLQPVRSTYSRLFPISPRSTSTA